MKTHKKVIDESKSVWIEDVFGEHLYVCYNGSQASGIALRDIECVKAMRDILDEYISIKESL